MPDLRYRTGTCSVAADGEIVIFSSALMLQHAMIGDHISINRLPSVEVVSVDDQTHLGIEPWNGSTLAGVPYVLFQDSILRSTRGQTAVDSAKLNSAFSSIGYIYFVAPGGEPDPSDGYEGQVAFEPVSHNQWRRTAGVWVPESAEATVAAITTVISQNSPAVLAWENNVPGDGSNQTAGLQAIIDGLPSTGGNILLRGDVRFTHISVAGRQNVRFSGLGGSGSGADQRSMMTCTAGASSTPAIDARDTWAIDFESLFLSAPDTAFNQEIIRFGKISTFAADMSMRDCVVKYNGTLAAINLMCSLTGSFESLQFLGTGSAVRLQDEVLSGGLLFCNVHNFQACRWNPDGSAFPILGSGEAISFRDCNVQASTLDGKGRFWKTSTTQPFNVCNIENTAFYDVTAPGEVWCTFYNGFNLNFLRNMVSGPSDTGNYGITLGGSGNGVKGFTVIGNAAKDIGALINFDDGSGSSKATSGLVAANTVRGGNSNLYLNLGLAGSLVNLPNYIEHSASAVGSHFFYQGLPTSSSGLESGSFYNDSGTLKVAW